MALAWVAQAASLQSMSLYSFLPLLYISGWFLSHWTISFSWASVILTSLFFLYLLWVGSSDSSVSSAWVAWVAGSPGSDACVSGNSSRSLHHISSLRNISKNISKVHRCEHTEETFASDANCLRGPPFIVSRQFMMNIIMHIVADW